MTKKLSFVIVVFINCLFILKYGYRFTDLAWLLVIAFIALACLIYVKWDLIYSKNLLRKAIAILSLVVPLLLAVVAYLVVDLPSLNVDRWSVIDNFLNYLFQGRYPYFAESHMGNPPGPMPVYYLIALPFYTFKGYSFLAVLGYSLVSFLVVRYRQNYKNFVVLLSLLSVFMIYEIFALSNVFTYSVLTVLPLLFFEDNIKNRGFRLLFACVFLGLILSTRSVYSLVYVVFFISYLKMKVLSLRQIFIYSVVIISVFTLTFVPLILAYGDSFMRMNPFTVQSSFLVPQIYVCFFFIVALFFGWWARTDAQRFFYSGITLFIAICIYAGYHINQSGIYTAYIESKIDLTYFILCVPFLLVASSLDKMKLNSVPS